MALPSPVPLCTAMMFSTAVQPGLRSAGPHCNTACTSGAYPAKLSSAMIRSRTTAFSGEPAVCGLCSFSNPDRVANGCAEENRLLAAPNGSMSCDCHRCTSSAVTATTNKKGPATPNRLFPIASPVGTCYGFAQLLLWLVLRYLRILFTRLHRNGDTATPTPAVAAPPTMPGL